MELESKNIPPQFEEEHEEHYTIQRVASIIWIKRFAVLSLIFSLAQIVLNAIHFYTYHMHLVAVLLLSGIAFFVGTVLIFNWAKQSQRAYVQSRELFQPRVNDRFTRAIFIMGLLFAAETVILFVNLLMQRGYSEDYITAQDTNGTIWDARYKGLTPEGLSKFYNLSFLIQAGFMGFYFFYFIWTGRTAFKCLKWDNQGMSYFVFVTNVILLGAALGLVYYCKFASGFDDYPHVRENMPRWNITILLVLGILAAVVSFIGFLVDHRGWRVGFLLLGALCFVIIGLTAAFTGLAYKSTDKTYDYYEGENSPNTCQTRLYAIHKIHIEKYGCPEKYIPNDECKPSQWVTRWEPVQANEVERPDDATTQDKKESGVAPEQEKSTDTDAETDTDEEQGAAPEEETDTDEEQGAGPEEETDTDEEQGAAPEEETDTDEEQGANPEEETDTDNSNDNAPQQSSNSTGTTSTDDEDETNQTPGNAGQNNTTIETDDEDEQSNQQTGNTTTTTTTTTGNQNESDNENENGNGNSTQNTTTTTDGNNTNTSTTVTTTSDDGAATTTTTTTSSSSSSTSNMFTFAADGTQNYYDTTDYCLNTKCCGLLGQLYSRHMLNMANMGLLTILISCLITMACHYFWRVKYVDIARDRKKDFVWLGLMVLVFVVFIVVTILTKKPYLAEKLNANGQSTFI